MTEYEFWQIAVDTAGVVASAALAVVASIIAYRTAYGREPAFLVEMYGLDWKKNNPPDSFRATMKLTVWNNRTYPISLRNIAMTFQNMELLQLPEPEGPVRTAIAGSTVTIWPEAVIASKAYHSVEIDVPFKKRTLDDLISSTKITLRFFDPVSGTSKFAYGKHLYHFGAAGALV